MALSSFSKRLLPGLVGLTSIVVAWVAIFAVAAASAQAPVLPPGDEFPAPREERISCRDLLIDCAATDAGSLPACVRGLELRTECRGTGLGKLISERAALGSHQDRDESEPGLVILNCLSNFDNQLLGYAIADRLEAPELRTLSAMLTLCEQTISGELMRP